LSTVCDVPCPSCKALKHRACVSKTGRKLSRNDSHARRRLAAPGVQLDLVSNPVPPPIVGIDLGLGDVADLAKDSGLHGKFRLIHVDAPWKYDNVGVNGAADKKYGGLPISTIIEHVNSAYDLAEEDAYMLFWCTCPMQRDWFVQEAAAQKVGEFRWRYVSGGAWGKRPDEGRDRKGSGTHMRGDAEVPFLYVKGNPRPYYAYLTNWTVTERPAHSEKPVSWLREVLRCLVPPDARVVDYYAGRGSMARACYSEYREYLGREIDPNRLEQGLGSLSRYANLHPRSQAVAL